ncbi:MAG: carbon-nitrogen family hydrolase [Acidobacteria bacterium]|nr:carbon-nitrogen family hydrolase [Acidobacteriota bacterium]
MRVAAVQHEIVWESPEENFERLEKRVASVAGGADLILLSEMFSTGFSMDAARIVEPPGGPAHQFLQRMADTFEVAIGGSVATSRGDDLPVNRFVMAAPNHSLRYYDKIHPFSYGGEDEHYGAGTELVGWDVAGLRVTPFVCYDLRFADEFWARALDTDCYLVVANWPAKRAEHWKALLRARAIENLAYVVGVNRVGSGGGLDYLGDTMIVDPLGVVDAITGPVESTLVSTIDNAEVRRQRERFGFLADRR